MGGLRGSSCGATGSEGKVRRTRETEVSRAGKLRVVGNHGERVDGISREGSCGAPGARRAGAVTQGSGGS